MNSALAVDLRKSGDRFFIRLQIGCWDLAGFLGGHARLSYRDAGEAGPRWTQVGSHSAVVARLAASFQLSS